jgi:hypothetical protein
MFSVALSVATGLNPHPWPLASTLPCGVRTFLPLAHPPARNAGANRRAIARLLASNSYCSACARPLNRSNAPAADAKISLGPPVLLDSVSRDRACSSVGRAPRSQRGGQGFEPPHVHQAIPSDRIRNQMVKRWASWAGLLLLVLSSILLVFPKIPAYSDAGRTPVIEPHIPTLLTIFLLAFSFLLLAAGRSAGRSARPGPKP